MSNSSTPQAGRVPAVRQALRLLRHMAAADKPSSVSLLARATGISPSSCFNLLRTLADEGIVAFDQASKTYQLGFGLLEIASPLIGRDENVLIRQLLDRIARRYHALITLWQVTDHDRITLIDRMHGNSTVRIEMRLGARVPALAGAIGRSVAASTRPPLSELRRRFATLRWQVPISFEEFRADIERARADGFGVDLDHWTRGVHAVGTVVLDGKRIPRLCIGGLALAGELPLNELRTLGGELRDAARLIGQSLYGAGQINTAAETRAGAVRNQ